MGVIPHLLFVLNKCSRLFLQSQNSLHLPAIFFFPTKTMKLLPFAFLLPSLTTALQPAHPLSPRQNLCPVPCGEGWCCQIGQKCIPGKLDPSVKYDCDDELLKTTWPAVNLGVFSSAIDVLTSVASEYSITTHFSFTPTIPSPTFTPTRSLGPLVTETNAAKSMGGELKVVGVVAGVFGLVLL
ncbi:hypothetical protein B0T14DRAFT_517854 [Immersiella caudata]|uniref:Uncharacterized protein n=1 Tax=Immersiella caudata TaxID=314043 RepID=A0AA40C428_9PEZI|nr:hypothetical protein B0T14DRAFT_517854 [Immersiella caudata]